MPIFAAIEKRISGMPRLAVSLEVEASSPEEARRVLEEIWQEARKKKTLEDCPSLWASGSIEIPEIGEVVYHQSDGYKNDHYSLIISNGEGGTTGDHPPEGWRDIYKLGLEAGVKDNSYRAPKGWTVSSYSGTAEIIMGDGTRWKVVGHEPSLHRDGFIGLYPL